MKGIHRIGLLVLSIVLLCLGSPNRWIHWFPGALLGIAILFLVIWQMPFWAKVRYSFGVWFLFCLFLFLPDLTSVKVLGVREIIGGILIAPVLPIFYLAATVLSLEFTKKCPLGIRPLAMATVWTALDGWLGLIWFPIPFHWGSLLYDWPLGIQIADLSGIWGVTFFAVLVNASLASLVVGFLQGLRGIRWVSGILISFTVAVVGYGSVQLWHYDRPSESLIQVGTVQPMAWFETEDRSWTYREQRYKDLLKLSQQGVAQGAELIIWPEGALRAKLVNTPLEPYLLNQLKPILSPSGSWITGAAEPDPRYSQLSEPEQKLNNAALLYDATGQLQDRFGKQWLFPFFETQRYIPSVAGYQPMRGSAAWGVMICLESVLPSPSRQLVKNGAQVLIAISDDSWFGNSHWPKLHGILSVFRAIENRRSFIFVNNTGGNLIVDPSGRIQQQGEIFQRDVVVGQVVARDEITLFNQVGEGWILLALSSGLAWSWMQYGSLRRSHSG
ncbi:MAG: apolipoprotein N-acyltransferase [Cyanobacteriota bacterium]|nr:apolipoprotein N-acyltransferase [Cyanobacteriota bacterium]